MTFSQSIAACLAKYATFSGRARRSEYWWFYIFTVLLSWAASLVGHVTISEAPDVMNWIVQLALFVPSLAVFVRRLHDTNRSGWWFLLAFTIVGIIPLIIWLATDGEKTDNRFGAPAKT